MDGGPGPSILESSSVWLGVVALLPRFDDGSGGQATWLGVIALLPRGAGSNSNLLGDFALVPSMAPAWLGQSGVKALLLVRGPHRLGGFALVPGLEPDWLE